LIFWVDPKPEHNFRAEQTEMELAFSSIFTQPDPTWHNPIRPDPCPPTQLRFWHNLRVEITRKRESYSRRRLFMSGHSYAVVPSDGVSGEGMGLLFVSVIPPLQFLLKKCSGLLGRRLAQSRAFYFARLIPRTY